MGGRNNQSDDSDHDNLEEPTPLHENFYAMCSNDWCNYRELIKEKDFTNFNKHKIECKEQFEKGNRYICVDGIETFVSIEQEGLEAEAIEKTNSNINQQHIANDQASDLSSS